LADQRSATPANDPVAVKFAGAVGGRSAPSRSADAVFDAADSLPDASTAVTL